MATLLDKIRNIVEDGYDIVRDGASTVIDKAEDFGKMSKIKFEIRQLGVNVEKKLTLLGDAVFPHLVKNNVDKLKDNPAIKLVVEEIQDLNKKIDDKQKIVDTLIVENSKVQQTKEHEKMQTKINALEKEIEERMEILNKLRSDKK